MIIEFYKYLTNPATHSAKKLGQLRETIAMEARYKRSKKQWDSHLENTKQLIKAAAEDIAEKSDVIILGSGLLLDIPIEYLAKKFSHVYLIDVVHLKTTKQLCKKYNNVLFIEHDVTGLAEQMVHNPADKIDFQPALKIPKISAKTGLVVSANMLSQIHLSPIFFAEENLDFNEEKLEKLAHDIMSAHLQLLKETSCKVCLITDNKRVYKDRNQNITNAEEVLFNIELPEPDESWYWEIAPIGELDKNLSMTSLVYAYKNFKGPLIKSD